MRLFNDEVTMYDGLRRIKDEGSRVMAKRETGLARRGSNQGRL